MVLEVGNNEIKTFCYEDSTISTIVPERHMFMGNTYFYGKIISMFGDVKGKGANKVFKYMMMAEMFNGNNTMGNGNNNSMIPMMMMMNGGMDDIFNFDFDLGDIEEDTEENEEEE